MKPSGDHAPPRPFVGILGGGMLAVQPGELGLDHLETLGGHEIMRRNWAVRQVVIDLAALRLFGEGLAHGLDYNTLAPGMWPLMPLPLLWASGARRGKTPLLDAGRHAKLLGKSTLSCRVGGTNR